MSDRPWYVISPEICEMIPLLDDGTGPWECGREVVEVWAPTKRAAIIAGVKLMTEWPTIARHDYERSPFAGVTAELAECPHGVAELPPADRIERLSNCDECDADWKWWSLLDTEIFNMEQAGGDR